MKSLLIYSYECRRNARYICESSQDELYVVEADYPFDSMAKPNLHVSSYDSYIDLNDYDKADNWISQFWQNWLLIDGVDVSEFKGISLRDSVSGILLNGLYKLVREVIISKKILDMIAPDVIYCGPGETVNPNLWENMAKKRKIKYFQLRPEVESEFYLPASYFYSEMPVFFNARYKAKLVSNKVLSGVNNILNLALKNISYCLKSKKMKNIILMVEKPGKKNNKLGIDINSLTAKGFEMSTLNSFEIVKTRKSLHGKVAEIAEKHFEEKWKMFSEWQNVNRAICYDGIDLWPYLNKDVKNIFKVVFPKMAVESETAKAVLETMETAALLSKVDYSGASLVWFENAFQKNIQRIILQREQFIPGANTGFPKVKSDWFLTQGPSSDEFLRRHAKVNPKQLFQYGNVTRNDLIAKVKNTNKVMVKRHYKINDKPIVLYADGHYCGTSFRESAIQYVSGLRCIYKAASELSDYNFLMKVHPGGKNNHREGKNYYARRMKNFQAEEIKNVRWLPKNSSISDIYALSPIVISLFSTACIEAMAIGLPAVYLFPPEAGNELPDFDDKNPAGIYVRHDFELPPLLKYLFANKSNWDEMFSKGRKKYWSYIFTEYKNPNEIISKILKSPTRCKNIIK